LTAAEGRDTLAGAAALLPARINANTPLHSHSGDCPRRPRPRCRLGLRPGPSRHGRAAAGHGVRRHPLAADDA